jgi:hypothetical protein
MMLSEHHGDGSPGISLRIAITGLDAFHAEITARRYRYARPGINEDFAGRAVSVTDPFGNRLTFVEAV